MLNGTAEKSLLVAAVMASTVFLAGCDVNGAPKSVPAREAALAIPTAWYDGDWPILRFRMDPKRGRGWILTAQGVLLFDFKTRQTSAHIALPGWLWLGEAYSCAPDLALGPQGEVLVTSNVVPTLWRIDPLSLEVSRHEVVLDQDNDRDVGFSALAYSSKQAAFFGASSLNGSLWRIDPSLKRAQKVALSAPIGARSCAD